MRQERTDIPSNMIVSLEVSLHCRVYSASDRGGLVSQTIQIIRIEK